MNQNDDDSVGDDSFPVTHWSLVGRVRAADPDAKRQALSELITRYRPVLKNHLVRRRGMNDDQADDLLQSFLCDKVVERNFVERAEQQRGKFRTFLLTALQNYARSDYRKTSARKRSPGSLQEIDTIDPASSSEGPADEAFDLEWARSLVANVLTQMKEHCRKVGREDVWRVFEGRLLGPIMEGREPPAYDDMAKELGFASPTQAANALVTAKRTFERLLRAAVGQYAREINAIDEEIGDLQRILASKKG